MIKMMTIMMMNTTNDELDGRGDSDDFNDDGVDGDDGDVIENDDTK